MIVYVGLICCFGYLNELCVLSDVFACLLLLCFGLCLFILVWVYYIGLNVVIACLYYGWVGLVWLVMCCLRWLLFIFVCVCGVDFCDGFKADCDGACLNWRRFELFCGLVDLIVIN